MPKVLTPQQKKSLAKSPKKDNPKKEHEQEPSSAAPSKKPALKKLEKRPVLYPSVTMSLCDAENPLTAEGAKALLGWTEESENLKIGENELLLKDERGVKIKCLNNINNRELNLAQVSILMQEILRNRWRFNGETVIVGQTGLILNGQHSLIALVLAAQKVTDKPGQFAEWWQGEPWIEKLIVYGVSEDDEVVNTLDTGRPRNLTDVFFRSEMFTKWKKGDRRKGAKMADYAVRVLWHRTGGANAFCKNRSHAESMDFVQRHRKLLECVKHIYEENGKDGRISRFLHPGTASGLMYLMGAALTERERENKTGYSDVDNPDETLIDWGMWEKAQEFFVLLGGAHKDLAAVQAAFAAFENRPTSNEAQAVLIKAWELWTSNKKVTADKLQLSYTEDGDGYQVLAETPIVGGIDLGRPPVI